MRIIKFTLILRRVANPAVRVFLLAFKISLKRTYLVTLMPNSFENESSKLY